MIQLDANLLDTGTFAWAIVQHEYAHEVDFLLLDDRARRVLAGFLGGSVWGAGVTAAQGVAHDDQTGERFADAVATAYWPSAANAIRNAPDRRREAAFRNLLGGLLGTLVHGLQPVPSAAGQTSAVAAGAAAGARYLSSLELAREAVAGGF